MAEVKVKKGLTRAQYEGVVALAKDGKGRAEIQRQLSLSDGQVGKTLAHAGLTNSKAEVVKRDTAIVEAWIAKAGEKAPRRRSTRKSAAKKRTAGARKAAARKKVAAKK